MSKHTKGGIQMNKAYDTLGEVSIEEFVNQFKAAKTKYSMLDKKSKRKHKFTVTAKDGNKYELGKKSLRYHTFYKNLDCVGCGSKGSYFLIQKTKDKKEIPHANLYTCNDEIMTKDHIIRKSEGGKNHINNLQTMCHTCNCVIKQ